MTENGSFIVNGSERVIVSQLHRSPGVIFLEKSLPTGRTPTAQIIPYRGAWVEFEIDTKDQIYVRIDKRKKLPATVLLRALGWESDADILKLYAKTERLVLAGWQVTHAEGPAKQLKSGDLLDAADFRQASTDYPDLEVERCYRVTEVTDKNCPLEIGQELTYKDRTNLRRKWKGFETELFRRVVDTHNSGCELIPGQVLTNSEYEGARARYGSKAFTAEQILSQDSQESVGRVCAEDIINPETGEVLLTANTLLTETELERLGEAGVEALTVLDAEDCQHIRFLRNTLERDRQADYEEPYTLKDAALLTIFRTLRPGDPAGLENARKHLSWLLFDAHRYDLGVVGRYKLNRKFQNIPVYGEPPEETLRTLRPEDIAATVDYLLKVHNGIAPKDDLDHLGNRRVRVIGELLENQFRMGLFQIRRTTRERLSTDNDIAKVVPSSLVNPKPLMMALREFFGSNQLSQFMQQINPLDELTHKRRISAIGPGGLHRDRATAAVRDVHRTHYGRVCPLETPEGPSIGLIVSLACYGRINPYGFIETPYHRVDEDAKLGPVEYLTADTARATQRNGKQTGDGDAAASEHLLPVRSGEDVLSLPMEKVDYIGVSPQQIVGISAALVPFLEHEDANRALMGANHQRQAVPLVRPEAPLVGTGMEAPAALYSGALITAKRAGTVTSVSAGETLHHDQGENTFSEMGYDVYKLQTFKRSNSGTCIHQHPIVAVGDIVEAEQVIVDGTSTENGELALGRNVLCAYMPWGGHNYEDSILISETLIKEDTFTSIHIEEFEVEARETKVGPEEITRDIPNVSEQRLTQLDEEGIIRVGSVVGAGSILVGKITPKGESEYGPEEKLLRAIFGEKVKEVRDASTYVRPGVEGVVIDVKVFSRKPDGASRRGSWTPSDSGLSTADNLRYESKRKEIEETWREQIASIRRRKIEETRNTLIGCELADSLYMVNIHVPNANAREHIQRVEEMAQGRITTYTEEKERALQQLEMGDELKPGVIKRVKVYVASKRPISVGDKMAGRYGNKGVIAKILPAEDMPYLPDGTPVELVLNPLGVPSRMNVGQILEIHLGWACHELGIRVATPVFDGATEGEIFEMLGKTDLPKRSKQSGKSILFDGRTGDPFAQEVTVGYVYFLKLNHLVADKMHARSTGPYSLVTQQPLGGKAQHGGQRLGEMEVWALEAYGAAHTLQEMLTLKSDDVLGRREIYESVVKGLNPEPPGTPESFKVLVRELQTLGLYVSLDKDEDCLLQPSSHSVIIFEVCFSNPPAPLLQATGFV
ncbi:DNA-directed RNA polymerase subunit beta [Geodia barretti]|uniref:DNA-directed RNA polymerase n=1 Tax=Geodia barretti TaxID=519541 RepID=A0AA35W800_GEOBA|nr:DNA-directed RNA polymerase subunit beta [Geodia barretti]